MGVKNYYEVLEVAPKATALEIKKAYRKLALKHHPDRNNGSTASTELFKEIGEAYECLTDDDQRRSYDASLRRGGGGGGGHENFQRRPAGGRQRHGRDPFAQFDDLFGNDPFFRDAMADLDKTFAERFAGRAGAAGTPPPPQREGWVPWVFRKLGVQFTMTTTTSGMGGQRTASSYSSSSRGSYTSKKSRTYTDSQGRRVIVNSMEQNGNLIQDTMIDNELAERKVNGVVETRGTIEL